MEQVPDDLRLCFARGAQHWHQTGEVITRGVLLDEVPTHTVTRRADADLLEALVILNNKFVVSSCRDEVESDAGETAQCFTSRETVGGAFESTDPKALK